MIYLIECRKCGKQYVGEKENPLHLRMNGHRSELSDKPVAVDCNSIGHTFEDLTAMIIGLISSADATKRRIRESYSP